MYQVANQKKLTEKQSSSILVRGRSIVMSWNLFTHLSGSYRWFLCLFIAKRITNFYLPVGRIRFLVSYLGNTNSMYLGASNGHQIWKTSKFNRIFFWLYRHDYLSFPSAKKIKKGGKNLPQFLLAYMHV